MKYRASSRILALVAMVAVLVTVTACTLTGTTVEETPEFEGPPRVTIASPQPNATYLAGTSVNILARVENAGPELQRVEISVNDTIIGDQDVSAQAGAPAISISTSYPTSETGTFVISVVAYRPDGTASEPATVTITVREPESDAPTDTPTDEPAPTATPTDAPTVSTDNQSADNSSNNPPPATQNIAQPTQSTQQQQPAANPTNTPQPASPTPNTPRIVVDVGANIRSGPGTVFAPPIGSLAAGTETELLARSIDSQWYKISYYNGEGWIAASLVTTSGDVSSLPVDIGPPTPLPPSPTPQPSATPEPSQVDLSIVDWSTSPFPLVCAQSIPTRIRVANTGTNTSGATTVILEDIYNGSVTVSATADIGALAPNQSQEVTIPLTVTVNFSEGHTLRARVDPNNTVAETNENNNGRQVEYVLSKGSCG